MKNWNKIFSELFSHYTFYDRLKIKLQFYDILKYTIQDLWFLAGLKNELRFIDLLELYYPSVEALRFPEEFKKQVINGRYVPNSDKREIKLVISFYIKIRCDNIDKLVFFNFHVSESKLYYLNKDAYLKKRFFKQFFKNMIKYNLNLNDVFLTNVDIIYTFKQSKPRK